MGEYLLPFIVYTFIYSHTPGSMNRLFTDFLSELWQVFWGILRNWGCLELFWGHFGAYSGRVLGVNDFLLWEAGKFYSEKGVLSINLGESNPGSGAYNFKAKQLKAEPREITHYTKENKLSTKPLLLKVREKAIVSLCAQHYLPSFLAKRLLMKRGSYGRFI